MRTADSQGAGVVAAESSAAGALEAVDATDQLQLLLVDPRDLVHWGLRSVLSHEPWVEQLVTAHDSAEALQLARRYRPHVAIVDTDFALDSARDLCDGLREQSPATRILLTCPERVPGSPATSLGAAGAVPNTWPARDIVAAARSVALGRTVYGPTSEHVASLLTARERRVLELVAEGATNREAARQLHLSHHTVKDHVSSLCRKLHARNRAEAIARAQRLGLLA
jgi:DNA-binding NarL/FixJ family response regulator